MAARGEKRAAAHLAFCIPAILSIPRPDAMVVIDLAVMQSAYQPGVNERLGSQKLRGITALKTDARFCARLLCGLLHGKDVGPLDSERFFNYDMFAGARRCNELVGVLIGVACNIHHV